MANVKAVLRTDDVSDPREWAMDFASLDVGEMMTLERLSNSTIDEYEESMRAGSGTALMLLLFVMRKRNEPALTLEQLKSMPYHKITFELDVEAEDESGPKDLPPSPEAPEAPTA